ncbi:hypothetical protein L249_8417 [Ophiocordyceps polyrhachis-furcata BCC 54312]|uniref:RRM domain-containing protein n=1 Tax=Ophiocordyceps polyrhachis-furcata BCC 54312 TaxID=1330021 RepID=A0A367L6U2_9HYPO|nr:hypothetical protein L249_8417 [Ophiocordyceps polyrhachis-furcata BCC 54312]
MPRNEAPDNTIMRDVPPGEETGIYYIIISGLPFGTIWQLLKDWLRHAGCDVDHIEVFQKSTSGWIRLIGKPNFERALPVHLQTVPYDNRLILYLDKNRTESVKIMELIDDPPPKPKLGGGPQASRVRSKFRASDKMQKNRCSAAVAPVHYQPEPASEPASPLLGRYYGDESRSQYGVMAEPFGPPPSARGVPYAPPAYAPVYHGALEPPGSPASCPKRDALPGYRLLRYEPAGRASDSSSPRALPHDVDNGRCLVKIDPLRNGVTLTDVEGWVRSIMGEWASALSRVEVVGMSQRSGGGGGAGGAGGGGRFRPFAYVTFLSSAAAKRAVELLNSKPLRSRSVTVRLVDDEPYRGLSRDDEYYGGARRASSDGRLPLSPPPAPPVPAPHIPSTVRQSALGGDTVTKTDATNAAPVIAHGTFYRPSKS